MIRHALCFLVSAMLVTTAFATTPSTTPNASNSLSRVNSFGNLGSGSASPPRYAAAVGAANAPKACKDANGNAVACPQGTSTPSTTTGAGAAGGMSTGLYLGLTAVAMVVVGVSATGGGSNSNGQSISAP